MPAPSSNSENKQMFRWFLKPRFYSKCLTYVKCIKTRLETIQKKRNAVLKFIKGDVAELLKRGHDYDAYKRAEGLLLEQNMSFCYELIEKFIGCISDHLQDLTKQSDCPDECKEAVPSLMYAAARVADLPELRSLRTMFTEKFGDSLEPYTSKELIEKLRRDPPVRESKIRLLHDIAQEFSIDWDGKALEQRLSRHPSLHEERPKLDKTDDLHIKEKHTDGKDYFNASKGKERDTTSHGRKDFNDESWKHQSSSDDDDDTSTDMSSVHGRKPSSSSLGSISEDETETKKPSYRHVPPPYLKERTNKGESNPKKTTTDYEAPMNKEPNHDIHEKPMPRSVRRRPFQSIPNQYDTVSNPKTYDSQQSEYDNGQNRRPTGSYVRGISLPHETKNSVETSKGHARSISLGTEMMGGTGRVHPNLPDYDDLAARLRALRGR